MVLLFANFCQPPKMGVTSILNEVRVRARAMYKWEYNVVEVSRDLKSLRMYLMALRWTLSITGEV